MNFILLGIVAFCGILEISSEFTHEGYDRAQKTHLYKYNGNIYTVSELAHQYYAKNPQYAEASFLNLQRQPIVTESRHSYNESQNNQQLSANQQGQTHIDKNQEPTREEIANSQVVTSFNPNRGQQNTFTNGPAGGITFPGSNSILLNTFGSGQPLPGSIPTEVTGFTRKIPENRERELIEFPANAVTNFAWNLFKFSNSQPNYVISALSPQVLLSYLAWVANGPTRNELLASNVFGSPVQIQKLIQSMLSDGSGRELQIATAFFYSTDMRLNQEFFDKSVDTADLVKVDFKNPTEASRSISRWATQKTKGGLQLNEINHSTETKVALTSAIYFKGKFIYSFQEAQPGFFYSPTGPVNSKMMSMKRKFNWGTLGNFAEWVSIPYESSDALVIILPNKGFSIENVMTTMNVQDLGNLIEAIDSDSSRATVNLTLPKFKLESTTNLVDPLRRMGIATLFTPRAELPYFSDYAAVKITNAQQQASLDVNEEGTVLIAFTTLNVVALSFQLPVPDIDFNVNRPFIAMIVDTKKKIPFVMAKISNPVS